MSRREPSKWVWRSHEGAYQIKLPDALRTPHQTRAKAITRRGSTRAPRMPPEQPRQFSPLDPVEIGGEEDAIFQRDVARACEIKWARVEIDAALGFAAWVDRVSWVDELYDCRWGGDVCRREYRGLRGFGRRGDGLGWNLGDDVEVVLATGKVSDIERREVGHLSWCDP